MALANAANIRSHLNGNVANLAKLAADSRLVITWRLAHIDVCNGSLPVLSGGKCFFSLKP